MFKETALARSVRVMFAGGVAVAITAAALPAMAQDTGTDAPMQRVEVTGSSIKRADVEGALPVQTVTREDIRKMGVTSTEQLLNQVSSISAVGATNVAEGAGASTYGISTASLRGLGSNKTLILVNGRRVASYATDGASVDVNSIPLASVDHVEILKDGASGVYGSDAIGGVINFILRNNYQGLEVTGYGAGTGDGGGATSKLSVLGGWGDFDKDRYNFTVSADLSHDKPITGAQRSYANSAWDNSGFRDNSATGGGAISAFNPSTTAVNGVVPNTLATLGSGLGNPLSPNNCGAVGSGYDANLGTCRYNSSPLVPLAPDVKRQNLSGAFRFKLDDNNEFFVEGFRSHQKTITDEQASPYSNSFLSTDNAFATANVYPSIIVSPTSPYYPTAYLAGTSAAGKPVSVSYRAYDAGGRSHNDIADQTHLVIGFKGVVKGFDYDVAYTHNESEVSEATLGGYQSQLALVQLLSNNNAFNPFAQYQSPALAAQIKATNYNGPMMDATLRNDSLAGHISGDLYKLPAGTATFAVGGSLTDENLKQNPSAAYQSGDISGYGGNILPVSASRSSQALFGEINVPIIQHLDADLAVRTDRYSSVKSTNPKLSLRYQPFSTLLFRGSYGKGFREASLPEMFNADTRGTSATFADPVTGQTGQYTVTSGGNANLKPEKSEQATFGVVIDPIKDLSISIDYWQIKVKNLVTVLDPEFIVSSVAAGNTSYASLVSRDADGNITNIQSTNVNAGSLKTSGIDLDARYKLWKSDTYGTYSLHLNGTYTSKFDETLPDGTVQKSVGRTVDASGTPLNAVANGGVIFHWKDQLTFDWMLHDFGISATNNFQSGYYDNVRADAEDGSNPPHVGGFSTWNLQASYTGIKNLSLRVGVNNLFNRPPPAAITTGVYFQTGYDPSYYDAHGQTGYVTATYKF